MAIKTSWEKPGDLFSKPKGEQITPNHGNMTRWADRENRSDPNAHWPWNYDVVANKASLFVQTQYHMSPRALRAHGRKGKPFSKKPLSHNKQKDRREWAQPGQFKESSFLCGQHGVIDGHRRERAITESEQKVARVEQFRHKRGIMNEPNINPGSFKTTYPYN